MRCEQMRYRVSFILYGENLRRVFIYRDDEGKMIVRVDLHHMTQRQVEKVIHDIILMNQESFILDLIHGYNHGTALKNMILNLVSNKRIEKKWVNPWNMGETFLEIKSVY